MPKDPASASHRGIPGIKPTITRVQVGATSKSLETLLGEALLETTGVVTLRPHANGIFMDDGTASAASDPLGTSSIEFKGGHDELDELEFYAASNTYMTVIQEG